MNGPCKNGVYSMCSVGDEYVFVGDGVGSLLCYSLSKGAGGDGGVEDGSINVNSAMKGGKSRHSAGKKVNGSCEYAVGVCTKVRQDHVYFLANFFMRVKCIKQHLNFDCLID